MRDNWYKNNGRERHATQAPAAAATPRLASTIPAIPSMAPHSGSGVEEDVTAGNYLVRWKGYGAEKDSWKMEKDLDYAKNLIDDFEN